MGRLVLTTTTMHAMADGWYGFYQF